jgi:acetolactate synthase-1/3 small subunit
MNNDFVVLQKAGHYNETQQMFEELRDSVGVLQFIRSGRVAITRSKVERLSDMLETIQEQYEKSKIAE